jgi:hypothetical protein
MRGPFDRRGHSSVVLDVLVQDASGLSMTTLTAPDARSVSAAVPIVRDLVAVRIDASQGTVSGSCIGRPCQSRQSRHRAVWPYGAIAEDAGITRVRPLGGHPQIRLRVGRLHDENFWEIQLFTSLWHLIVGVDHGRCGSLPSQRICLVRQPAPSSTETPYGGRAAYPTTGHAPQTAR